MIARRIKNATMMGHRRIVTTVTMPSGDYEAASRVATILENYAAQLREKGGPGSARGELSITDHSGEVRISWSAEWIEE